MRAFPRDSAPEFRVFARLRTPERIQDFLDAMPINFERGGDTYRSPLHAIRHNEAHCMEGAMLAAAILWHHGKRPLLLDLKTKRNDVDHVVALFRRGPHWGAISKTNHPVLRYRDPIYRTIRELALSYFNEYFLDTGEKTLREYSAPFSLLRYGERWLTDEDDAWDIANDLDNARHFPLIPKGARLRRADMLEITSTRMTEWHAAGKKQEKRK